MLNFMKDKKSPSDKSERLSLFTEFMSQFVKLVALPLLDYYPLLHHTIIIFNDDHVHSFGEVIKIQLKLVITNDRFDRSCKYNSS